MSDVVCAVRSSERRAFFSAVEKQSRLEPDFQKVKDREIHVSLILFQERIQGSAYLIVRFWGWVNQAD